MNDLTAAAVKKKMYFSHMKFLDLNAFLFQLTKKIKIVSVESS